LAWNSNWLGIVGFEATTFQSQEISFDDLLSHKAKILVENGALRYASGAIVVKFSI
jgi:hypothetical protein